MIEHYYKVKSKNNTFYAIVKDTTHEYRIKFGGSRDCVNISVYKDDTIPNINGISYDKRCNKDETLIPGEGTIDMVKTAVTFARTLFPENSKDFMFKDTSAITCNKKIKIPLHYYYLTKHGKTWYQTKFHAVPEFISHLKDLENALIILNDPEVKAKTDFKAFYKMYFRECKIRDLEKEFTELYNNAKTYREFLMSIIENYDCGILNIWFKKFWVNTCNFQFNEYFWRIPEETIRTWQEVQITKKRKKPEFTMSGGCKLNYIAKNKEFFPYGKDYKGAL
jgi:hypothetical protein